MTSRTRTTLLAVIAVGWLLLAVANLLKHRIGVGLLYLAIGFVLATMALAAKRGRRAR